MVSEADGVASVHDGVFDWVACGGEHRFERDSFVEAGPSPLRYLIAVFSGAMQMKKLKWRSPKPPWWQGGVAVLRRDEAENPVGLVRGGFVCNILPDHGLEGSEVVQGQGVCHEAVERNRDELDVY